MRGRPGAQNRCPPRRSATCSGMRWGSRHGSASAPRGGPSGWLPQVETCIQQRPTRSGRVIRESPWPAVYHYAPKHHALELRASTKKEYREASGGGQDDFLSPFPPSIGARPGSRVNALSATASTMSGTRLRPCWLAASLVGRLAAGSAAGVVATGDRGGDWHRPRRGFAEAEREEPGCIMATVDAESADCFQTTVQGLVIGIAATGS